MWSCRRPFQCLDLSACDGRDLETETLDRFEMVALWYSAESHLDHRPVQPVQPVVLQELVDDFLRTTDQQPRPRCRLCLECGTRDEKAPPALTIVLGHSLREVGIHGLPRLLTGAADETMRVDADRQVRRLVAGLLGRCPIQFARLLM